MAGIVRKFVKTSKSPAGAAPFSQAIVVDRTMYISGQIGQDFSGKLVSDNIREQTEQTLKNMGGILNSQGADFSNDMKNYPAVNEVYKKFFPSNFPTRAAYQVTALPKDALIEIEGIAILGPVEDVQFED